ncbi:MAG TPA: glycosyltransferase family 2 protein [Vicinamibacteria bacterium]|nr:glycosyltransferase family 2 protein [Vicinamibacteria bacterium]
MSAPRVSAVVVSFEARDDLAACLASLDAHGGPGLEVVVVDNASTDGSANLVARSHPQARLVRNPRNAGFGRACNQGAAAAGAPYVLFLNPDARLTPGALDALVRVLDDEPGVGIVGPRTVNDDGTPQLSFGPALGLLAEWRQRRLVRGVRKRDPGILRRVEAMTTAAGEPDWVSGSCLLIRRSAFEQVGGFDEAFFLYEEDVDLCVRVRAAGWRVRFEPRAVVQHALGRSMARDPYRARLEYERSHLRYYRKHNGPLEWAVLRAGTTVQAAARLVCGLIRPGERPRE